MRASQKLAAVRAKHVSNQTTSRKSSARIKPSVVAVYISAFAILVAMVSIGYCKPKSPTSVANVINIDTPTQVAKTSVDDVVATNIAASVAQTANLSIATSVMNLAVSTQTLNDYIQTDGVNNIKPQIIQSNVTNRSIKDYTTAIGDTVDSLTTKFGISKETIKWANNLTSDALEVGKTIRVLPVNGVAYTVKDGDTIDSIASKYQVDKTRLVVYNDLDVSGLKVSTEIILPDGILPETERPGYRPPAPVAPALNYYYFAGSSNSNGYAYGNCTWYAYERRVQLSLPVGGNWGNANTWAIYAAASGYQVDNTPAAGAVMVDTNGWFGHVAIVESVEANGDIIISEMNNYAYGGWNRVNNRTISAGQASAYRYVH